MSYVDDLFAEVSRPLPSLLSDWEDTVYDWCDEYTESAGTAELSEIKIGQAVFLFDHAAERVVLVYALSVQPIEKRDVSRMRGFPDPRHSVEAVLGERAFPADRGHFLGHTAGGRLDINLFPQRRDLNRGWSAEGKRFRKMECYIAAQAGTFFFHRPVYDDPSWIPAELEFGVLVNDSEWWTDRFRNKPQ
jgi:hypothetical protein